MPSPSAFTKILLISLSLAVGTLGLLFWYTQREPTIGGNFQLVSETGAWSFADHAKPINVFYVGYVKCPDVCPMTLSYAASGFKQLTTEELNKTQLIFLSVDFQHDTAKDVADYARQFFPSFIGLTGTESQIDQAVNLYRASYFLEKDPKSFLGYSIAHTDRLFILDDKGRLLDSLSSPRSAIEITQKIKEHL